MKQAINWVNCYDGQLCHLTITARLPSFTYSHQIKPAGGSRQGKRDGFPAADGGSAELLAEGLVGASMCGFQERLDDLLGLTNKRTTTG